MPLPPAKTRRKQSARQLIPNTARPPVLARIENGLSAFSTWRAKSRWRYSRESCPAPDAGRAAAAGYERT